VPGIRVYLFIAVFAALQGCATSSLFVPYPTQAQSWKQAASNGTSPQAIARLETKTDGADRLLYLQERARLAQFAEQRDLSRQLFASVFELYEQQDAEAKIRASEGVSGVASLMVNDNTIPYSGFPYERIYAHGFQALNFLEQGDMAGAEVELRRAALEQRVAAQRFEKEIARAEEKAEQENIDLEQYEGHFQGLNTAAGQVKSAIQNAWTFYLSAAVWEGRGEYNDALVDYKKALEIHPDSDLLKEDVQRVSAKLDGRRPETGLVVVSHEQGFVPPRREISIPVPTVHGYFAVAFPTYQPQDFQSPRPLQVRAGSTGTATRPLANTGGMAAKALKERMPAIWVRQTLRATAKYNTQKKANEDFGLFGALATQVYNLVSEQADLRSWLTLPAHAQATRLELGPGEHLLELSTSGASANVKVPVAAGGVTLVRVIDVGGPLQISVIPVQEAR
jgi:hypothetical protein